MAVRRLLVLLFFVLLPGGCSGLFAGRFSLPALTFDLPEVPSTAPRLLRTIAYSGIGPSVKIRDVPGKGKGAFTTVDVQADSFLGYYHGEYLTESQVFKRYPCLARVDPPATRTESLEAGCGYLFGLDFDGADYVDAVKPWKSNWIRYVNHSERRFNTISYIDDSAPENPMIYLSATRDIAAGEELLFDYGKEYWAGFAGYIAD